MAIALTMDHFSDEILSYWHFSCTGIIAMTTLSLLSAHTTRVDTDTADPAVERGAEITTMEADEAHIDRAADDSIMSKVRVRRT